jgi:hypothetical protein
MEQVTNIQNELVAISVSLENNLKLAAKPNKAAIGRARKNLQEIKKTSQLLRVALLEYKKSL